MNRGSVRAQDLPLTGASLDGEPLTEAEKKALLSSASGLVRRGQKVGTVSKSASRGKFARSSELCEELSERQERVLIFTQFREIVAPLVQYLTQLFGRPGLSLDGSTPVFRRRALVDEFQREDGPPFFVLSLTAGGTGLNLTGASHVIHFDRWRNPAVENQAADRAFRIGQQRNVFVHKFVCRGTVDEKIDALIESKATLSHNLLDEDSGQLLTEMKDEDLLRTVALDIHKACDA